MPAAGMSSTPYVGHCSKCGKLLELDTSTALCAKCSPSPPKPKKDDSNGS